MGVLGRGRQKNPRSGVLIGLQAQKTEMPAMDTSGEIAESGKFGTTFSAL
jgi:hypothetical protein